MRDAIIKFSIVIPLYNKEATVERAIRSALNQTVHDFEIIVVNDGSTDNGARVVESIGDPRIRLIHQANQGVSAARNRGIAEARYAFIAFLDADDEWLTEFLEVIRRMVIRYPDCGLYATRYFLRSPSGKQQSAIVHGLPDDFEGILENYFKIAVRSHPPVWTSATCARKSVLKHIGGFPVGVTAGEDLLTWARIAIENNIAYSSVCCSIYSIGASETYESPPSRTPDNDDVVGRSLNELLKTIAPGEYSSLRHYCAHWHKMRASLYLRLGIRSKAHAEIYQSLNYHFRMMLLAYWIIGFLPSKMILSIFHISRVRHLQQEINPTEIKSTVISIQDKSDKRNILFKTKSDFIKHYEKEAKVYDSAREQTTDGLWVTNQEISFLVDNFKLRHGSTVLEAGCGMGRILLPLAIKGYRCFGIDPSQQMLNKAHEKDVHSCLAGRLSVGDIENIPFPDDTFDAVYTANVLQWLPDGYEKSFREMYRVAKNNAIVIMDFPNNNSLWRIIKRAINWKKESNKTFSYEELESAFKKLTKDNFIIKSQFSYPQKLFKYKPFRFLASFIEKMCPLPIKLRGKFYVIVTKNEKCKKLKICILGDALSLCSGHSKPAYELSVELIKSGIDVVFLTNELNKEIKLKNLQLSEKYPELKKVDFITIKKLKWSEFEKDKIINKIENCDYFHFFTPSLSVMNKFTDLFPGRVIWQITSDYLTINDLYQYGRPYLNYFFHSPKKIGNLLSKYFYKFVGRKCKTVICTTKYTHERFLKLGINPSNVKYIPFGVGINSDAGEKKTQSGKGLVFMYFGWLSQARGFTDLQVAFEKVHSELKESKLIVANPGVHLEEEKMLDNIRKSKHFSAIQILPWQKDIAKVLKKADVIVLPFRGAFGYSQPPLVIAEAMINSKPVISTNIGSIKELIDHEKTGLLIEPENINDLINSMLSFADKRRCVNMGKEAYKKIQENNWQNVIGNYLKLYNVARP